MIVLLTVWALPQLFRMELIVPILTLGGGHGMPAVPVCDEATQKQVLERDGNACVYCGFVAKKYQLVRAKPGVSNPSGAADHITTCIFCEQCLHVDDVPHMKSGVLIWLPELSQADLNHLVRAIYVARISQGGIADTARRMLDVLLSRREQVLKRIRTDDPAVLASVLRDFISARAYNDREAKLEGVRLLPLDRRMVREGELEFNQFPQILAYWRSKDGPFGQMMPNTWGGLYTQLKGEAHAA